MKTKLQTIFRQSGHTNRCRGSRFYNIPHRC
jgi:hypothetical protein